MLEDNRQSSLQTLHEIRNIMERSARFISLSGWSGIWAGTVALLASLYVGWCMPSLVSVVDTQTLEVGYMPTADDMVVPTLRFAAFVFCLALAGSFLFTWLKVRRQNGRIWGKASRQLAVATAIPFVAGAAFCLCFLLNGLYDYLVPASLAFYGMSLVNGSKYTLSEIKYLGYVNLALGCISLFFPGYGLYFWAAGFGILHIVYGIIMWFKYDRHPVSQV